MVARRDRRTRDLPVGGLRRQHATGGNARRRSTCGGRRRCRVQGTCAFQTPPRASCSLRMAAAAAASAAVISPWPTCWCTRGLRRCLLDLLTRERRGVGRRVHARLPVPTSSGWGVSRVRSGPSTGPARKAKSRVCLSPVSARARARRPRSSRRRHARGIVRAVVSRGGRPGSRGRRSAARGSADATLLIVGGHDEPVIELNREAMARMRALVELAIVSGCDAPVRRARRARPRVAARGGLVPASSGGPRRMHTRHPGRRVATVPGHVRGNPSLVAGDDSKSGEAGCTAGRRGGQPAARVGGHRYRCARGDGNRHCGAGCLEPAGRSRPRARRRERGRRPRRARYESWRSWARTASVCACGFAPRSCPRCSTASRREKSPTEVIFAPAGATGGGHRRDARMPVPGWRQRGGTTHKYRSAPSFVRTVSSGIQSPRRNW